MKYLKILKWVFSITTVVFGVLWIINPKNELYEPIITTVTALLTLILFFIDRKKSNENSDFNSVKMKKSNNNNIVQENSGTVNITTEKKNAD